MTDTFPASVCDVLRSRIPDFVNEFWQADVGVSELMFDRPLRTTDPEGSISVYPMDWSPVDQEIGLHEPSIQKYELTLEVFTRGVSDPTVRALHSRRSKALRAMLYRDTGLRVAFAQLEEELAGVTEKFGRFGVTRQRYFQESAGATFFYLSSINAWFETNS